MCRDPHDWVHRIPQLVALLVETAPQLRSFHLEYPDTFLPYGVNVTTRRAFTSVLPEQVGCFRQLTNLSVKFGLFTVTTAQVDAMLQKLPLLQHLQLLQHLSQSFDIPASIASSCRQLRSLDIHGLTGDVPHELWGLTDLTRLSLGCNKVSASASISSLVSLQELKIIVRSGPGLYEGVSLC